MSIRNCLFCFLYMKIVTNGRPIIIRRMANRAHCITSRGNSGVTLESPNALSSKIASGVSKTANGNKNSISMAMTLANIYTVCILCTISNEVNLILIILLLWSLIQAPIYIAFNILLCSYQCWLWQLLIIL